MNVGNVLGNVLRGRTNAETPAAPMDREDAERKAEKVRKGVSDCLQARLDVWNLLEKCMRLVYDSDSFLTAVNQIIALTGAYMGASRSYCFWLKDDRIDRIYNSFVWTSEDEEAEEEALDRAGDLRISLWNSLFDGRDYLVLSEEKELEQSIPDGLKSGFAREQISGLILIPLSYQDRLVQLIAYDNPKIGREEQNALADSLYCLLNINTGRIYDKKRNFELSFCDSLTGLYNRAKFWKDMGDATEEERKNTGIVLLYMKNLRQVNESQGHEAGNQLLKRCAALIDEIMPGEIVYRIGGSEFILWMQQLEQNEFAEKVMSLKEAFSGKKGLSGAVAARWTEFAEDMYQLAMAADEDMNRESGETNRRSYFRR